jgi:hypothetical protein
MSSNSGGDGTVEVYSTLTDLEAVKLMDFLRKVNYTKSLDDLAKEETWHWNRGSQSQEYGLDDDDMVSVGKLIEKLGGGAAMAVKTIYIESHGHIRNADNSMAWVSTLGKRQSICMSGCWRLKVMPTLPSSMTSIEYGAFRSCPQLKEVTIPSSITRITKNAFTHCRSLKEIMIPRSVEVDEGAFDGSTKVTRIGSSSDMAPAPKLARLARLAMLKPAKGKAW